MKKLSHAHLLPKPLAKRSTAPIVVDSESIQQSEVKASLRQMYCDRWSRITAATAPRHVSSWDGGVSRNGIRQSEKWQKLFKWLQNHGCDESEMEFYIDFCFSAELKQLQPSQLANESRWKKFQLHRQSQPDDFYVQQQLKQDVQNFKVLLYETSQWISDNNTSAVCRAAVLSTVVAVSPLFRYIVCISERLPDLASLWLSEASSQFRLRRHSYVKYWGSLLPAEWSRSDAVTDTN